jgi:hypothetical protein
LTIKRRARNANAAYKTRFTMENTRAITCNRPGRAWVAVRRQPQRLCTIDGSFSAGVRDNSVSSCRSYNGANGPGTSTNAFPMALSPSRARPSCAPARRRPAVLPPTRGRRSSRFASRTWWWPETLKSFGRPLYSVRRISNEIAEPCEAMLGY